MASPLAIQSLPIDEPSEVALCSDNWEADLIISWLGFVGRSKLFWSGVPLMDDSGSFVITSTYNSKSNNCEWILENQKNYHRHHFITQTI